MYGLLVLIWLAPYKLKAESDRFKKTHNDFAVRTTNEIDELFSKIGHIQEVRKPGKPTEKRLKKLDYLLTSRSNEAMTFSEIGKILELGSRKGKACTREQNMTHFGKRLEEAKDRFAITPNRTSGGKLVHLTT
jgi:hypothetical protein